MNIKHDNDLEVVIDWFSLASDPGTIVTDGVMTVTARDTDGNAVTGFSAISATYSAGEQAYIASIDKTVVNTMTKNTRYYVIAETSNYDWKESIQVFIIDPEPA